MPSSPPTLRMERTLLRAGARYVAGLDEVGRGALAGPVSVGLVVIDATVATAPKGLRDSKLLTASTRENLVPAIQGWACAYAVGHSSPQEIDRWGMTRSLRLAAFRALENSAIFPDVLILDGAHDWFTQAQGAPSLFDEPGSVSESASLDPWAAASAQWPMVPAVHTRIKADQSCSSVAAASVLAKVQRDAILRQLHETSPWFSWQDNKGYSSPAHIEALAMRGPSSQHRLSWRLPGVVQQEPNTLRKTVSGVISDDGGS